LAATLGGSYAYLSCKEECDPTDFCSLKNTSTFNYAP
jgi:hypothetical protein